MRWSKATWYKSKVTAQSFFVKMMKIGIPRVIDGQDNLEKLIEEVKNINKILIVTDKVLVELGLLDNMIKRFDEEKIKYIIYDKVKPNPTIQQVEEVRKTFIDEECCGFIAFGGGSVIDCAKAAGARITNPLKSVKDMGGILKVGKKIPKLYAVPTTAGTGSEATLAAVITDSETHEKFAINDPKLMPYAAVLDPSLTLKLPKHITATTGMDALTHAVEAYIGKCCTKFTDEMAEKAVMLIKSNLDEAYINGDNIIARENMLNASYYAGMAFTRAFIGYVHSIAHTLGGLYGVPHGLANAIVLPYVLDYYGESIHKKLAKLSILCDLGDISEGDEQLSKKFILWVREMNKKMNIPDKIKEIRSEDIELIASRAVEEANGKYPVPKLMDLSECIELINKLV